MLHYYCIINNTHNFNNGCIFALKIYDARKVLLLGNIAAFFDIDGTLHRDSLMIEHFKKLIKFEVINDKYWYDQLKHTYEKWVKRKGEYDNYLLEAAQIYIDSLKGVKREIIDYTSDRVINLKFDKVYRYTRAMIKWHVDMGHTVIFISGSPDFLVEKMSKMYDATDYIGTKYIFEDGVFSGKIEPMWESKDKNVAIGKFIKKYDIDLSQCYAYGDTNGDLSMLKKVKHPVAINPTHELVYKIKSEPELSEKISIIVERKDVIYNLKSDIDTIEL